MEVAGGTVAVWKVCQDFFALKQRRSWTELSSKGQRISAKKTKKTTDMLLGSQLLTLCLFKIFKLNQ